MKLTEMYVWKVIDTFRYRVHESGANHNSQVMPSQVLSCPIILHSKEASEPLASHAVYYLTVKPYQ